MFFFILNLHLLIFVLYAIDVYIPTLELQFTQILTLP